MSGLFGEPVGSIKTSVARKEFSMTPLSVGSYLKGSAAQDCFIDTSKGCFSESDEPHWRLSCGPGKVCVGVARYITYNNHYALK